MSKLKGDPGYRDGWCIHYRSSNEFRDGKEVTTCEAGVPFSTWEKTPFEHRPCFLAKGQPKPGSAPCALLRLPTPEEIAAHNEWSQKRQQNFYVAFAHILPWREANKGRGAAQTIDCPVCGGKGTFSMTISARKGHVHARCSTEGCVSWME